MKLLGSLVIAAHAQQTLPRCVQCQWAMDVTTGEGKGVEIRPLRNIILKQAFTTPSSHLSLLNRKLCVFRQPYVIHSEKELKSVSINPI